MQKNREKFIEKDPSLIYGFLLLTWNKFRPIQSQAGIYFKAQQAIAFC
jgi:hypothetical protein